MRTKVTLVLLFLNLALFAFIFRFERAWRTELAARDVRQRVLGAEAANLSAIEVASALPGASYRLERRGAEWRLTKPFDWPANPAAVDRIRADLQLLDDETSFSVQDMEKNGQTLADYGLDQPALVVTFVAGGPDATGGPAVTTTLKVGAATKVGQRRYLLSPDGQRIHVIDPAKLASLSLPLDQLRSDAVLTIPVFEARSLNLLPPTGPRVRIQRDGARWLFETPVPARADKEAVELALNRLDGLRVQAFAAEGTPIPAAPPLRISIEGNNRTETLFLEGAATAPGSGEGAHLSYAQLEDPGKPSDRSVLFTVEVPDALDRSLRGAADALRDRHVLDFDPTAISAVTLHAPGAPDLALQRLEPGAGPATWQMVLPAGGAKGPQIVAADDESVRRLLQNLSLLTAERMRDAPSDADLEGWGLTQPERRITLQSGSSAQTLGIGRPTDASDPDLYAQLDNFPTVYAIRPDILADASIAPRDWRDRQLMTLPDTAVLTALTVTDLTTGKPVLEWKSGAPAAPRQAAIAQIGAQWRQLRAARFAEDAFAAPGSREGSWRYRLEATFRLPGGSAADAPSSHLLYVTERQSGTEQWAGAAEFGAVFALGQPMIDALWSVTYGDRDPGQPAP